MYCRFYLQTSHYDSYQLLGSGGMGELLEPNMNDLVKLRMIKFDKVRLSIVNPLQKPSRYLFLVSKTE